MTYTLTASGNGVLRSDGLFIPFDPANTDYQAYLAWVAGGNTATPLPGLTSDQELASRIANGIAITSTSNSALNGTYALDATSQAQIFQIGLYANQFATFPSGGTTLEYPDSSGTPHNFTVVAFVAFLKAVASLVSALTTQAGIMAQGGSPSWPPQSAEIA